MKIFSLVSVAFSAAVCWQNFNASAAAANVSVINFAFVPATTNISLNDEVIWTWPPGSTFHNVTSTSTPAGWAASATLSGPATFTNTFSTPGNYPYKCTVHGFTGSITVSSPPPPVITNASMSLPGTFQFSYSATIGLTYRVERSPDLTNWSIVITNTAASGLPSFVDHQATNGLNFYRVGQIANP